MITKHDDGGPAYPRQYDDVRHDGETMWDRYAAAALQGHMSAAESQGHSLEIVAVIAAKAADAMLAERRKRGIGT